MSTIQPRQFTAATDVLAFMQAFTTQSVRHSSEAVQPRPSGSRRVRSLLRSHRTARGRWA